MASSPAENDREHLAPVIQLHTEARSCFTCWHARFPELDIAGPVTYCTVYSEVIDSEAYAAEDCFTYDRCDEGAQPDDTDYLNGEGEL